MKIGIDAGCLGIDDERLKVGVYSVVKNLLIELSKLDKLNDYCLYSFYPINRDLMQSFGKNMHNVVIKPMHGWLKFGLPLRLFLDKPDIFIAANQAIPLKLIGSKYKTLGIFYDIAFEKYPELYSYAASVKKHKNNSLLLAKKADKIVSISESTKKDLIKFYNVPKEKIAVAYPGIEKWQGTKKFKNKNPYFLFVGASKKSKNIPVLLRSFVKFLHGVDKSCDLIIVGGDKWLDPEIEVAMQEVPKEYRGNVQLLGFVDKTKLSALYRGAFAFVSPSLYEGFGLPFIEAQSVGVPVIGSNRGSLPEIIGNSGLLVNPQSSTAISLAMTSLMRDKSLYQKLSKKGKRNASKYSWKLFAKKVQSAITSIA